MSTQQNPKTLLNLMNIHKTRTFQIFEFHSKLEIFQFSSFEIVQFSKDLSIFEFQEKDKMMRKGYIRIIYTK